MNTHSIDLVDYRAQSRGNSILYLGTAGSHGNEQLQVTQGKGWEGLTVQVVFHPCKVAVQLPANGLLDVPWEATAQPLTAMQGRIVFQGFDQDRLVNSTDLAYTVASHSPTLGRDEQPYTPGIVEGVLNQMAADKDAILQAAQQTGQAKEAAAASAAAAASSAANAQQSAGAANTSAGQAAASASQAAGSAAAANETLTQVQTAGQEAQQKVKDAETEALGNISAAAPALPAVSAAAAWQSVTAKPDGTGYNLAAMAPIEATIRPTVTGNPAVCKDSTAWAFQGLAIYGKSTQDGTPSPENPVPIVSAGNIGSFDLSIFSFSGNLFDTSNLSKPQILNGITIKQLDDGGISISGVPSIQSGMILTIYTNDNIVLPAGNYYVGGSEFAKVRVHRKEGHYAYFANSVFSLKDGDTLGTYIQIPVDTYTPSVFYPILNIGNDPISFEPCQKFQLLAVSTSNGLPGIPVESGGNYTDVSGQQWICNIKDYSSGKYLQRAYKIVLDQNSNIFTAQSGDLTTFSIKLPYMAQKDQNFSQSTGGIKIPALSDYYEFITSGLVGSELDAKFGIYNYRESNVSQLFINDRRFSTIDEYKAWLANNPVTFIYAIETPAQSDIPPEELAAYHALTTYSSTTVVSTAEPVAGIEARYVMDGNKYRESVDKRLAALEAAQTGI